MNKFNKFISSAAIYLGRLDIAGILLLAIGLRLHGLTKDGLWFDEIFGSAYCNLNFFEIIVAVIRFDIHPPFYYLQLKCWSQLFGNTDFSLLLNTVFWSTTTVFVVFLSIREKFGRKPALLAALFTAVLAGEVYFSHELRMYSMITCLSVASMWLADRSARQESNKNFIALVVLMAIMPALHGASIIPVSSALTYFFLNSFPLTKRSVGRFTILLCTTCAVMIPCLANSIVHSISHGSAFGIFPLFRTIAGWILGGAGYSKTLIFPTASALILLIVCSLGINRDNLRIALSFVLWPLFFGAVISTFIRPMWLDRSYSFCAPFIAIILQGLVTTPIRPVSWRLHSWFKKFIFPAVITACFFIFVFFSVKQGSGGFKMQYRETANYLKSVIHSGDIIYIPDNYTFWAFARYFVGDSWGNLLKIQDSQKIDHSDRWGELYRKMGPTWLRRLHLIGETRILKCGDISLYIGYSPSEDIRKCRHLWVVGDIHFKNEDIDIGTHQLINTYREFRGMKLYEYVKN